MNNNLFTPDNKITVSKSPFASYTNEEMIFDGRITPISLEHIMFKVKRGYIYGMDFVILEGLSELEFATSRMITQYLTLKNIETTQDKVHNRLKVMNKAGIISRFKFVSDEGKSEARAYCLERPGKYLLLSRRYECNWKLSDNTRPLSMVKEILARNQLLLSYRMKASNLEQYVINPRLKLLKSNKSFQPHLQINVKHDDTVERIIVESVRSYDNYKETVLDRLMLYKEFYEYFSPTINLPRPPQIVILGEDDSHLLEIFKIIHKNKIALKNMGWLYTTDLRALSEKPSQSFITFDFVKVDGEVKAKVKQVNYKVFR